MRGGGRFGQLLERAPTFLTLLNTNCHEKRKKEKNSNKLIKHMRGVLAIWRVYSELVNPLKEYTHFANY